MAYLENTFLVELHLGAAGDGSACKFHAINFTLDLDVILYDDGRFAYAWYGSRFVYQDSCCTNRGAKNPECPAGRITQMCPVENKKHFGAIAPSIQRTSLWLGAAEGYVLVAHWCSSHVPTDDKSSYLPLQPGVIKAASVQPIWALPTVHWDLDISQSSSPAEESWQSSLFSPDDFVEGAFQSIHSLEECKMWLNFEERGRSRVLVRRKEAGAWKAEAAAMHAAKMESL